MCNVVEDLTGQFVFKQYEKDPITVESISIPPKLLIKMNGWKDSSRIVFETLLVLTNEGQYGILITAPQLSKLTNLAIPTVFLAFKFLSDCDWIKKEKYPGAGKPNILFINTEKIEEIAGEFKI